MTMNYAEIKPLDVANGPGIRVSVFVSGCEHGCKGCFNKVAWDFNYGKPFTKEVVDRIIDLMKPDYIKGITILGGEPLHPRNRPDVLFLLEEVKHFYPNKSIWLFTGYEYEKLDYEDPILDEILSRVDVLVDGPFIESKKNLNLKFRGSENQRLIDMRRTKYYGNVILWEDSQNKK